MACECSTQAGSGPGRGDMDATRRFIRLSEEDNVATLLDELSNLGRLSNGMNVQPRVPFGHKVALVDISAGMPVIKYGVVIGHATKDISAGEHVHVHNCA